MPRNYNTDRSGRSFSYLTIDQVWRKAITVPNYDPNIIRRDACGALMIKQHYGKTQSEYGWEIDHIRPVVHLGGDELSNLQALQWQNNRHKSDNVYWSCLIR